MNSPIHLFIFGSLLLAVRISAQNQCRFSMPFHQIISAPDGILTIDDEDGSRQIKATVFNTADCTMNPILLTGRNHPRFQNSTNIAQVGSDPNRCQVKVSGSDFAIDSFQAILVETNGWPLNDLDFRISDLDTAFDVREGAAVFGLHNGGIVLPNFVLPPVTKLKQQNFIMPQASNSQLGLSLGTVTVPGLYVRDSEAFNCPFTGSESETCFATVSFPVPVDSFVVIYMLEDPGTRSGRSLTLLSPFSTSCGCRCRENNPGTREVTVPVPSLSGECTQRETSGPKIECDVLGGRWCQKEPKSEYVLTGSTLPNGNLGCTGGPGSKLEAQQEFTPNPNFAGTV